MPDVDPIEADRGRAGDLEPPDGPRSRGTTTGTVLLGITIGMIVAGAVLWITSRDDEDPPSSQSDTASLNETAPITTADEDDPTLDPVDLVVAYGRSRTENHALTGELRREDRQPLPVRRGILDDRSLDEVGTTAAVTQDGETRQCERIDGEWLCAPPAPAIPSDIDVQGFAALLLTESPPYSVFAVMSEPPPELASITSLGPSTCWSMVSAGRRDRARFGAETTLCFHDQLGALVGRVTETSVADDLFVADEIRSDVTTADVEPSR